MAFDPIMQTRNHFHKSVKHNFDYFEVELEFFYKSYKAPHRKYIIKEPFTKNIEISHVTVFFRVTTVLKISQIMDVFLLAAQQFRP